MSNIKKMWNTMRVLKSFDVVTLKYCCLVNKGQKLTNKTVINYCAMLVRAGYLKKSNGNYVLIKNTGSQPILPIKTKGKVTKVLDNNLKTFVVLPSVRKKKDDIEKHMQKIKLFTVFDLANFTTSKANAKFYIHSFIKAGKVERYLDLKGYNHKLTQYKYLG